MKDSRESRLKDIYHLIRDACIYVVTMKDSRESRLKGRPNLADTLTVAGSYNEGF